eukprot:747268-Hanusia_phi.AAC.9
MTSSSPETHSPLLGCFSRMENGGKRLEELLLCDSDGRIEASEVMMMTRKRMRRDGRDDYDADADGDDELILTMMIATELCLSNVCSLNGSCFNAAMPSVAA